LALVFAGIDVDGDVCSLKLLPFFVFGVVIDAGDGFGEINAGLIPSTPGEGLGVERTAAEVGVDGAPATCVISALGRSPKHDVHTRDPPSSFSAGIAVR
jgi:hypothetical protein